jgi:hypothetical protein
MPISKLLDPAPRYPRSLGQLLSGKYRVEEFDPRSHELRTFLGNAMLERLRTVVTTRVPS